MECDLKIQELHAQNIKGFMEDLKKVTNMHDHISELKRFENARSKSLSETEQRMNIINNELVDLENKRAAELRVQSINFKKFVRK